jgi:predicted metal-dependent enzyme (double-stranded beta helix superfamily)
LTIFRKGEEYQGSFVFFIRISAMSYSLEDFSNECKIALSKSSGAEGTELVRQAVEKACKDNDFIAAYFPPDNNEERKLIYKDPELGFCIFTHVYTGAKTSPPHDHGPSWAIYGQAEGTTEMTDWRCVEKPSQDSPGLVEKVKTYKLTPGMAYAYQVGELHSPLRTGSTKLIRIEGMNMEGVQRDAYMVAS